MVTPDEVWKAGSRTSRGRMNRDEGALRDEKGRAVGKKSWRAGERARRGAPSEISDSGCVFCSPRRAEVTPPKLLSNISQVSGSPTGGPPSLTSEN